MASKEVKTITNSTDLPAGAPVHDGDYKECSALARSGALVTNKRQQCLRVSGEVK